MSQTRRGNSYASYFGLLINIEINTGLLAWSEAASDRWVNHSLNSIRPSASARPTTRAIATTSSVFRPITSTSPFGKLRAIRRTPASRSALGRPELPGQDYLTGPGEGEEAGSARQRARRNKKMGYCSPFEAGERMSVAGSRHLPGVSASKIFIVWRAKIMLRNTHLITVK
jgi:hypothetical protein